MNDHLEKIEALLPDFQYVDADHDRIVTTVGFAAAFYFWGGQTVEKRNAVVECIEAFETAYGDQLTWAMDEDAGRRVKLSDKKLPPLRDYVKKLDEDDCISWYLASGDDTKAVSDYAISCLTERGWMNGQISTLRFQVPRALIFQPDSQKVLLELIFLCNARLEPFHGNAGLTAISTYDEIEWEPEKLDVATRYLALYTDDRVGDAMQAPHGIKGVNWLTFIGNTLTQRVGGPDAFAKYCRHFGVEAVPRGSGFLIRTGEYPQLGPVEEPAPDGYLHANAALRPLRNGNFGSMGTGSVNGERRFNRGTSDLWIRRFDAPGIWPPASFIGLPRMPVGMAPRKRITLKTGEACGVHGRYRHPGHKPVVPGDDDDTPQVVLLPGDIAPYWLKLGPHGEYLGRETVAWQLVAEL